MQTRMKTRQGLGTCRRRRRCGTAHGTSVRTVRIEARNMARVGTVLVTGTGGLEEGYVFPRAITQFLLANATSKQMAKPGVSDQLAAAMQAFVQMYEPHEAREDTVVSRHCGGSSRRRNWPVSAGTSPTWNTSSSARTSSPRW
jgi:hypothetical protein